MSEPQRCVYILPVDDEEQLARMADVVLTQRGHEVASASSAKQALDLRAGRVVAGLNDV